MPTARTCKIDASPYRDEIDRALLNGTSAYALEKAFRAAGTPIKSETILKHQRGCKVSTKTKIAISGAKVPAAIAEAIDASPPPVTAGGDFASVVRDKALEEMQAGRLRVTTKDGLAATALLDRRAEKEKDREFVFNLARLLSGAGQGAPDEITIEGDFAEVGLLAPPAVRAPVE